MDTEERGRTGSDPNPAKPELPPIRPFQGLPTVLFLGAIVGAVVVGGYLVLWHLHDPIQRSPKYLHGYAAFGACKHFMTATIDTPATAEYADYFSSDTRITLGGVSDPFYPFDTYTVVSYVDAQNSYGAMVRRGFKCIAAWVPSSQLWLLHDLSARPWNEAQPLPTPGTRPSPAISN